MTISEVEKIELFLTQLIDANEMSIRNNFEHTLEFELIKQIYHLDDNKLFYLVQLAYNWLRNGRKQEYRNDFSRYLLDHWKSAFGDFLRTFKLLT